MVRKETMAVSPSSAFVCVPSIRSTMTATPRKAAKRAAPKAVKSSVPRTAAEKAEAFKLLDVLMNESAKQDVLRELVAAHLEEHGKVRAQKPRPKLH